jgi:protein SCO1/2
VIAAVARAAVAVALAATLRLGDTVPATRFTDQAGRPFTFASWRGKFVVIAFIYTRCRDARECPLTSAKLARLQNLVGGDTRLAEVTIDPEYDRPKVLAAYAKTFGFKTGRVGLLTGDPKTVLGFAALFGVSAYTDPKYGFVHNESTVVVDPAGKIAEIIPENSWTPEEIASIIAHYRRRPKLPF